MLLSSSISLDCEGCENQGGKIYLALFIISHTIIFTWIYRELPLKEDELLTGDWIFNHDDGKYVANYYYWLNGCQTFNLGTRKVHSQKL